AAAAWFGRPLPTRQRDSLSANRERWVKTHLHCPSCRTKTQDDRSTSRKGCPWYFPPDTPRAVTTAVSPYTRTSGSSDVISVCVSAPDRTKLKKVALSPTLPSGPIMIQSSAI